MDAVNELAAECYAKIKRQIKWAGIDDGVTTEVCLKLIGDAIESERSKSAIFGYNMREDGYGLNDIPYLIEREVNENLKSKPAGE